jgi:hypothetical protein
MTKLMMKLAMTAAAMGAGGQGLAQTSASQPTTGSTTIIAPISLAKNSDLAFGTVTRPTGANTSLVKITSGGVFSITNGNAVAAGGTPTAATYNVNGESALNYSITLGTLTMNRSGGGSIPVTLAGSKASGSLTDGTDTFGVGGEFTIDKDTLLGVYSGSFNVTVQYN